MPDPAIQSINQHTQKTSLNWLDNILVQPSTGTGSGVAPAVHEQYGLSLDLLRQALVEVGNVVNNLTTTVPGKVLDARQGKVLADTIQAEIAKYAQPNGIATLGSDGKVPASQIPSLALVDVFPVESEAAMLASGAEQGDMAIRSDTSQVFILSASPASTLANWVELSALKALVDSALDAIKGDGYTSGTLKSHEDRLDTLEGTGEGSVAKAIEGAVSPLAEVVDTNRLYSDQQYIELKAKADAQALEIQASRAELYNGYKILQFGSTDIIGKGTKADYSAIDVSANVVDGKLSMEQKGLTITNLLENGDFSHGATGWIQESLTSVSVVDKVFKFTATAQGGKIRQSLPNTSNTGATYVVIAEVKANSNLITVSNYGGSSDSHSGSGQWETLVSLFPNYTVASDGRAYITDARASGWDEVQVRNVRAYNLTALCLSTITDTAILANLLPYVDGTKNVGKMGVKVVGKDLFDETLFDDEPIYYNPSYNRTKFFSVPYGSDVTLSITRPTSAPSLNAYAYLIDEYGNTIGDYFTFTSAGTISISRTVPTDKVAIIILKEFFNYAPTLFAWLKTCSFQLELGSSALPYEPYQEQLTFLPAIGNSLPNGTADSIKTVADGWEHTKRVEEVTSAMIPVYSQDAWATTGGWLSTGGTLSTFESTLRNTAPVGGGDVITRREITGCNGKLFILRVRRSSDGSLIIRANSNTTLLGIFSLTANVWSTIAIVSPSPLSTNSHYFIADDLESGGTFDIDWIWIGGTAYASGTGTAQDLGSTFSAINALAQLATPITTHYDLPLPTSGKTIHRFAGEEKIALYGTGLTFSENVLTVLSAVKFVAGVMTDITSLATITTNTVTFSGVNATDVVYVKVEHDVDRPLGVLEHTPAVSNTASRLAAIEAWIAAQGA